MGSCSFQSSHGRLCYCNGRSTVLLQDQLYYWEINHYAWRSTLLLEDQLYYWKINGVVRRSVVLLGDQLYWRQSTKINGNCRSRKKLHVNNVISMLEQNALLLVSPETYIKYAIQMSIHPEWFPGISESTHGGNGLKICLMTYPDHFQNWSD